MGTSRLRKRFGFTLIEVMIAVAVVSVLTASAVPNYRRVQLRAKASEAKVNLGAIRTAQESYFVEFGRFVSAGNHPSAWVPGMAAVRKLTWDDTSLGGFSIMGWEPEGDVFFQYHVEDPGGLGVEYVAEARSDLDGDGTPNVWGYVQPRVGQTVVTGNGSWGCLSTGVLFGTGIEIVGPCCPDCGQSIF